MAKSTWDLFPKEFFYLFRWIYGKDFDFSKFDFEKDRQTAEKLLSGILDATDADLSEFERLGGKLLILHGTADPIIPYTQTINYYDKVVEKQGSLEKTMNFCRLFLIPGMAHILGGPGCQDIWLGLHATPKDSQHLALLALKKWVEENDIPECLLPVAFEDNDVLNGHIKDKFAYERPVYPYPWEAEYIGGDVKKTESFRRKLRWPNGTTSKNSEVYIHMFGLIIAFGMTVQ